MSIEHVPTPHGTEEFLRYEAQPKERRVSCPSGCVIVAGGINGRIGSGPVLASGEVYNVATGTRGSAGTSAVARRMAAQVDDGGGVVTILGGATTNSATVPTATNAATSYNALQQEHRLRHRRGVRRHHGALGIAARVARRRVV